MAVWGSLLLVAFLSVYLMGMYHRVAGGCLRVSLFDIVIIIIGGPQSQLPTKTHERIILATFLLFTLVVRCLYLAALFKFMHSEKKHNELNSVDEMIKNDFTFYMYPSFTQHHKDMNYFSR